MTVSARKLAANRANAQASTGPRTAAGKAHSARNAVRHGLYGRAWARPAVSCAIEQWGQRIAGDATGEERQLAYAVAAAQVELDRAGEARRRLYADPHVAPLVAVGGWNGPPAPECDFEVLEELLSDTVHRLDAIARCEQGAAARRRRAWRALDALRTGEPLPPPRVRRLPPYPRGARLPRLPQLFGRVIKFAGVPRWAWWRPDPLDEPPKPRRTRRRKAPPQAAGELELLVAAAVRASPGPQVHDLCEAKPPAPPAPEPEPLTQDFHETKPPGPPAPGPGPTKELRQTNPPHAEHPPSPAGLAGGSISSRTMDRRVEPGGDAGERVAPPSPPTQHFYETKPPQPPPQPAASPPAPPATPSAPAAPQGAAIDRRRWGARPTPLPTCRAGPCRWNGELPADHWSYRGWRSLRSHARPASRGPPAWFVG